MVAIRITNSLPRIVDRGPDEMAPMNPPSTKMEDKLANWIWDMGMQSEKSQCFVDGSGLLLKSLHVKASAGALSSACRC